MSGGYKGMSKLRKLLKKVDPEARGLVADVIEGGAKAIENSMIISAPVDSGDLVHSISYKLGRDGLSAYIGPGADRAAITKKGFGQTRRRYTSTGNLTSATIKDLDARFQLYKAHWIEHGTKGHGGHPGQPARPFINPAYDANANRIKRDLSKAIDDALEMAARG